MQGAARATNTCCVLRKATQRSARVRRARGCGVGTPSTWRRSSSWISPRDTTTLQRAARADMWGCAQSWRAVKRSGGGQLHALPAPLNPSAHRTDVGDRSWLAVVAADGSAAGPGLT